MQNSHKINGILYKNSKSVENEIGKTITSKISATIFWNKNTYRKIFLNKSFKRMKEKIKSQEDGRKNFPCSEICKINTEKDGHCTKTIYNSTQYS